MGNVHSRNCPRRTKAGGPQSYLSRGTFVTVETPRFPTSSWSELPGQRLGLSNPCERIKQLLWIDGGPYSNKFGYEAGPNARCRTGRLFRPSQVSFSESRHHRYNI